MRDNLNFKPDWYKITKLWEPNVLEIEDTWFIKLKGIGDDVSKEELKQWLKEGNIVRIIPHWRNKDARIVSDVWLGNTHVNRQFPSYERDNLIQTFKRWHDVREDSETIKAEAELSEAFNTAWDLIPGALKKSFEKWKTCHLSQKRTGATLGETNEMTKKQSEEIKMIEDFNKWKEKQI